MRLNEEQNTLKIVLLREIFSIHYESNISREKSTKNISKIKKKIFSIVKNKIKNCLKI